MSDLKNCPFCGTKAVSSVFSVDVYNWYEEKVCCENCSCIISHPQAIQIWNTRPAEDAKDKEIERLKGALKRIAYYRDLNPDMKATEFAVDVESELSNFYCKMGDIAKMALGTENE